MLPLVSKSMYAEHTDEHFKLFCPIKLEGKEMIVNIYVKKTGKKGIPYIFEGLYKSYLDKGLGKTEAVEKAYDTINDFFNICDKLSKDLKRPFRLKIKPIDKSKIKKSFKS